MEGNPGEKRKRSEENGPNFDANNDTDTEIENEALVQSPKIQMECEANADEDELELKEEDQTVGSKNVSSVEKALSIELIVTEVFKNLTISELLHCSLVNKQWNFNARSILRDYKKCYALISGPKPCEDLLQLSNLLASSTSIPFNGLIINPHDDDDHGGIGTGDWNQQHHGHQGHYHTCVQSIKSQCRNRHQSEKSRKNNQDNFESRFGFSSVKELYSVFFEDMTLKYLKFYWKEENVCYNLSQFILLLLTTDSISNFSSSQCRNLIELSVCEFPHAISSLEQFGALLDADADTEADGDPIPNQPIIPKKFLWPKLKTLELPTTHYYNYMEAPLVNDFLAASPNLQTLCGHILPEYLDLIYTSDSKLSKIKITEFVLAFPPPGETNLHDAIDKLLEATLKFAQLLPRLQKLSVTTSHDRLNQRILRQNPAILCEILKQLFANSYTSVQQLQLDYQDFKNLTRVDIISPLIPLSRLKILTLKYDDSIDFYAHFNFVDLSPLFPVLEEIEFIGSCFTTRGFYLASLFRERYSGFSCVSVKKLTIFHLHIFSKFTDADGRFIRRISEFFPSVRELHLDDYGSDADFFDIVWNVWKELEVIHFYNVPEHISQHQQQQQQFVGGVVGGVAAFDPFFDGMRKRVKTFHRKFRTESKSTRGESVVSQMLK